MVSADVPALLAVAVAAIGGLPRPGQVAMAEAVDQAARSGEHLLVQAGTGTGKSLAYLVPALTHAVSRGRPVVISTATLALQAQIVDRDLPRVAHALAAELGRMPTWQLVKGRNNYLCRHKVLGGFPPEEESLFDLPDASGPPAVLATPSSRLGREVIRLRSWAEVTQTGDRDELEPGVSDRAWRQVSVSAHECLGSQRCPAAQECHSEAARARAREVDVVVTNHAVVAIDAFDQRTLLPEHDLLIVDEGHELADRVTSVISDELTVPAVEAAARRARRAGAAQAERLDDAAALLQAAIAALAPGRLTQLPELLQVAVASVRDAAREVASQLKTEPGAGPPDGARQVARAAVSELFDVADRLVGDDAGPQEPDVAQGPDVRWLSRQVRSDGTIRASVNVAPVSVAGLLRERLYPDRTVVITSATLTLGGSFDASAASVGLQLGRPTPGDPQPPAADVGDEIEGPAPGAPRWACLDVGSPFDYARQGILYLARALPPPGRDGIAASTLDELAALVTAAGGRTLGLFSSRRAAEVAAESLRERLDVPILCQGDDAMPNLVRSFARDARTCLFGTLSLWQGVDVPGSACQLVVIDRIPFPRPDDPLASARQEVVARGGGNGFMAVAATHAALRLAQGAGRLIRRADDRGVVAVLDSRLATARYGRFLRASLPPFWTTVDREAVLAALRRIDAGAPPPLPVAERGSGRHLVPLQPGVPDGVG